MVPDRMHHTLRTQTAGGAGKTSSAIVAPNATRSPMNTLALSACPTVEHLTYSPHLRKAAEEALEAYRAGRLPGGDLNSILSGFPR